MYAGRMTVSHSGWPAAGIALVCLAACTAETPSVGVSEQLQALEARFLAAFNKGDADALSRLFAVDGVRVISGAQLPSSGREAIKALFEVDIEEHNAQRENRLVSKTLAVRELGGGIVLADGSFQLDDKDGAATELGLRFALVDHHDRHPDPEPPHVRDIAQGIAPGRLGPCPERRAARKEHGGGCCGSADALGDGVRAVERAQARRAGGLISWSTRGVRGK